MYKMYNTQWDDESDNDKNSLNSSFWSDGEHEEEEEEEVETERVIGEEDSKPAAESVLEASEEEKPELKERIMSGESSESGSDDDDDEGCSSSCDSPAPSLMTSGYGTYRPEEQDGGETACDQDSRGDLSEARDDEEEDDGRSLCSFELDYSETRPLSVSADAEHEAHAAARGDDGLVDITHMNAGDNKDPAEEGEFKDVSFENEATNVTSEEGGRVDAEGGKQYERPEEVVQELEEENNVESEESSSNKDIKFIDSKVDFGRMTYDKLWEGNLRPKKGKQFPVCDLYLLTVSMSGVTILS